jgi:Zn-dependent protease
MHLAIRPARKTTKAAVHARSASLPHERSHPVIAYLGDSIRTLRSWSAGAACRASGIALVDAVLAALGDLLALPQAVEALHETAACDQLLDRFLVLADAYGSFQLALITLKQSVAELQAGTRRGDGVMIAASLRAHRRTEKELSHLVATMRHATRCTLAASRPMFTADDEVIGIVAEVAAATAQASEAIFMECAAMSPAVAQTSNKWLARLSIKPAAKKAAPETAMATLERLEKLEDCIDGLETGSEKVFRRLLQSRVSLLNIHSLLTL